MLVNDTLNTKKSPINKELANLTFRHTRLNLASLAHRRLAIVTSKFNVIGKLRTVARLSCCSYQSQVYWPLPTTAYVVD